MSEQSEKKADAILYAEKKMTENAPENWDRQNVSYVSQFYGYMVDFLMQVTPSPVSGSLEDAAEEYLNEKPGWAGDQNHFHTTRSIYLGDMKAAFLAGASHSFNKNVKLDKMIDNSEGILSELKAINAQPSFNKESFLKALREIVKLSNYDPNHDNMLYNIQEVNKLAKELLNQKEEK